jgi:hypothetical protein
MPCITVAKYRRVSARLGCWERGLGGSAQASEVEGELNALLDFFQQLLQVYPPKVTAACAQCAREGNVQGGV